MIVSSQTYNTSDPTVDSQVVSLKASGADVFFIVTVPKFSAQAIRKAYDIDWHPQEFVVQRRLVDRGRDQAGRLRGRQGHHLRGLPEGPGRSAMGGRSRR